jgi:transposase
MVSNYHLKETSMAQASTIGLDIAKQGLQAHGADAARQTVFRTRLTRAKVSGFFCVTSSVRLIPPACVKPFVKRQKNDVADAEAIGEAAQRPTIHQ